jgi:acyl-CoA reductase-like NAD-dependent aldehyde dehydrogenase
LDLFCWTYKCPVVVKPSKYTPLIALAAANLALQAGIPPGEEINIELEKSINSTIKEKKLRKAKRRSS